MTKKEPFDAVLLHCYMFDYKANGKVSLRNHLEESAFIQMYKRCEARKAFLAGGRLWKTADTSMSSLIAADLIRRGVSKNDVVIREEAKESSVEIDLFLEEQERQGWKNVASMANSSHLRRVGVIYQRRKENAGLIDAETILSDVQTGKKYPYRKFLHRFSESASEIAFRVKENILTLLYEHGLENQLRTFTERPLVQKLKSFFDK